MEELELSDYVNAHELKGFQSAEKSSSEASGRRTLRIAILILGVLCILQATLNISLYLAYQSPLNSSLKGALCQTERAQSYSTQLEEGCNEQLRRLQRKFNAMERDRDCLQDAVHQLSIENALLCQDSQGSGSILVEGSGIPD
ncbi:hypothetical protein LDENG_00170410 [Lucifuga dentata]|nr:hypothetical protein LDENG_00170410 [Lucifuga dentata]